jgi:WD40 repeat protein
VWDAETASRLKELQGHSINVWNALLLQDSKTIVSTSWDDSIRIWDAENGIQL